MEGIADKKAIANIHGNHERVANFKRLGIKGILTRLMNEYT